MLLLLVALLTSAFELAGVGYGVLASNCSYVPNIVPFISIAGFRAKLLVRINWFSIFSHLRHNRSVHNPCVSFASCRAQGTDSIDVHHVRTASMV